MRIAASPPDGPLVRSEKRIKNALPALTACCAGGAVGPALAQAPQPISIADQLVLTSGRTQDFSVVIPAVPEGYRVVVHVLARLQAEALSGSTPILQLRFNGTLLDRQRLANKSDELRVGLGERHALVWLVLDAPALQPGFRAGRWTGG